jgi:hypothetical protein
MAPNEVDSTKSIKLIDFDSTMGLNPKQEGSLKNEMLVQTKDQSMV